MASTMPVKQSSNSERRIEVVELTDAEFRLLVLFVENPARVLSRDELARIVLGREWSPLDRTLDGHVARLRRKLEGPTDEPRIIQKRANRRLRLRQRRLPALSAGARQSLRKSRCEHLRE